MDERADGGDLPSRTAAVELLNVLRPTVAVSVYIVFVAHALDRFPEWRTRLAQGDGSEDEMVVLDLYGTNHDPRSWDEPQRFDPERFRAHGDDPYGFVPQGGGDRLLNHRCPGEPVAVRLMMVAVDMLTRRMTYDVVASNADIDYRRLPALPTGGVTLTNVSLNR